MYTDRKQVNGCLVTDKKWQGQEGIRKNSRKGLKSGVRNF